MGPGVPTTLPSSKRVSPRLGSGSNVWQVLKACEKLGRMVSNDRPEPTPAENVHGLVQTVRRNSLMRLDHIAGKRPSIDHVPSDWAAET